MLWQAIDLVFNFSGMWHDIQTLTDDNANWWAKAAAVADLGVTVFTDINMLDGEGEAARAAEVGAEIAEKGVADVTESAGRDAAKVVEAGCGGGLSFLFTTKVATQQGEQAIGTLKVGAKVWAYNPNTKKMELQPILHVWINHDNDLVDLTITKTTPGKATKPTSEMLHTNKKHPFLTVEKGFLPVGQMKLGMHVMEADGQVGVISGWKIVPGMMVMYNLEVQQDHTYTVGMGQWIVHNSDCGITSNDIKFPESQVTHEYMGHPDVSSDMGLGNYNKGNASSYVQTLKDFVDYVATPIKGTYRSTTEAVHFFDPVSKMNVIVNSKTNEFIGAWKLGAEQVENLMRSGNVQ